MSRLNILSIILIISIPYASNAQKNVDTTKSLLWEISGKGLNKPSWLFGTLHFASFSNFLWTEQWNNAFNKAESICFESTSDTSFLNAVKINHTCLLNSAKSSFTTAEYQQVRKYILNNNYIDIDTFLNRTLLTTTVALMASNPDVLEYKKFLKNKAIKKNKKILSGLETAQYQANVLMSANCKYIVEDILAIVGGKVDLESETQQMINAFIAHDQYTLYKLGIRRSLVNDLQSPSLIPERNHNWLSRIDTMINQGSVFFAVGAAHLGGENGLISMLRNAGYTVTPIISDSSSSLSFFKPATPAYDLDQYLSNNVHYPREALAGRVEGSVIVRVTIADDGTIINSAVKKSVGYGCDDEALRVVQNMPKWTPATYNYLPIPTHQQIKIDFKLPEE